MYIPYCLIQPYFDPLEKPVSHELWPRDGDKIDVFTHHYVHIDKTVKGNPTNVTFHYISAGNPKHEAVVFTMGLSEPGIVYGEVMKKLLKEYYVLAVDGKGFPYSSEHVSNIFDPTTTDPGSNYSLSFQGEELVSALDKLGIKKFNLVSSDLMSIVTGFWVGEWPDRVLRYLRGQSHVGVNLPRHVPQGTFFKRFPQVAKTILQDLRVSIWSSLTGTGPWWLKGEKRTSKDFEVPSILDNRVKNILRAGNIVPWLYFWLELPKFTVITQMKEYKKIKCPVLLIQGIEDKAQPYWFYDGSKKLKVPDVIDDSFRSEVESVPEDQIEKYKAERYFTSSPWVRLIWIEGSGHFPHFEKPNEYAEALYEFLQVPSPIK